MKFTHGFWRMRDGLEAFFPAEVRDVTTGDREFTMFGPAKPIVSRGDTLNCPALTVTVFSPREGIIGVRIVHHIGERKRPPEFELKAQGGYTPVVKRDGDRIELAAGPVAARTTKGAPWGVEFVCDDRVVTSTGKKNIGHIHMDDGRTFTHEQLSLGVGEFVYGLGERFTPFVKNGQVVETWNEDGGTSSEIAYKSIPFYLTNRGYGVLVNHAGSVSFEVGSEKVERVQFSVPGEALEYYLIYGPTPKEVLARYTALTGRPALPPAWSFGLWLTTSFTTKYDEKTVTEFVDGMAERKIPLHVFHYDCFWMREFQWCDFVWDPEVFPDPAGMIANLHAKGLKVCVWINPYIAQRSYLFVEGAEHGYLVKTADGDVWQWDNWQSGMALVDFTNPDAYRWYQEKLAELIGIGVDTFKTDFGERIPTEVVYHDGADPERMHNYYTLLYNRAVFEVLAEKRGASEACLFARSATVGGQQYPVHWGGDSTATYESMAESLRGGLSLGLCGFGFWSHDIGGFEDTASPDVYKRWCAFGLLSSHSRLHGAGSYRVPWLYDEEAVDVLRFFVRLKCTLMPYLFAAAAEAHTAGIPTMRAMILEFPADPAIEYLDRQYMLGGSILVAPVFSPDGWVDFYLPAGVWTHLIDGHTVAGGRWVREQYDYLSLPVFARPGSIVVLGADETLTEYDYTDGMTVHVYEPAVGETITATVAAANGGNEPVGITAEYADGAVTVSLSRALPRWTAVVHRAGKTFTGEAADGVTGRAAAKSVRVDVRGE